MCKKTISREMFDFLTKHMAEIEKKRVPLVKKYYVSDVEEGTEVDDFFREYSNSIKKFLNTVKTAKNSDDSCPFIIIGSIAEVEDMDDRETYQYCIVLPYSENTDIDIDCASCLSPLGKALLFKGIGEQVNVQVPAGTLHYLVKKITLPEQLNLKLSSIKDSTGSNHALNLGLSM